MPYFDCHAHWCDPRVSSQNYLEMMRNCEKHQIKFILQGGVDPEDWQRQRELQVLFPKNIGTCFGLHPYFVAAKTSEECDFAMDELADAIIGANAIGEAGLDFRSQFIKSDRDRAHQINYFEQQIELARAVSKPLVLHLVRAHDEGLRVLQTWDLPVQPGFVHAFNSNFQTAKNYLDLGLMISVGGAVTHSKNRDLREAVIRIPLNQLLIESDSPDQAPAGWTGLNQSWSIWEVAREVSLLRGDISAEEMLKRSTENFKHLFSVPI
jgi:TatD DNase family protein